MTRQPPYITSVHGNEKFSASKMEKVKSRSSVEPYVTYSFQISIASEDSDSHGVYTLLIKVGGFQVDCCPSSKTFCPNLH